MFPTDFVFLISDRAMDDQEDSYNDDFSDSEGQNRDARDDQDEQHAQKVNGKIDSLQLRIEELQKELAVERKNQEDLRKNHETELYTIRMSSAREEKSQQSSENNSDELERYKSLCSKLKDQLDDALACAPVASCPFPLREEFHKFCKRSKIFTELREKDMTIENCIAILNHKKSAKQKAPSESGTSNVAISSEHQNLLDRIKLLEEELRLALGAAEDIRALKAKLLQMIERTRVEKESKLRAEAEFSAARRKIEMMTDHMEKLMVHLKHEAAHKARIAEQHRLSERDCAKIREKCDLVSRKGAAKDRLILELREGSKVLEDQLRLMDEKYLELRTKLDWARELGSKKVKKAEKVASELRMKFALTGSTTLLDNVPLPDMYNPNSSSYIGMGGPLSGGVSMSFDDQNSWASGMMSGIGNNYSNNNWQQQHQPQQQQGQGKSISKRNLLAKSTSSLGRTPGGVGGGGLNGGPSLASLDSLAVSTRSRPEPDMDTVLEKIRSQQGGKQDWTTEKIKKLTISR